MNPISKKDVKIYSMNRKVMQSLRVYHSGTYWFIMAKTLPKICQNMGFCAYTEKKRARENPYSGKIYAVRGDIIFFRIKVIMS